MITSSLSLQLTGVVTPYSLEDQGVAGFAKSYDGLLTTLAVKAGALAAR